MKLIGHIHRPNIWPIFRLESRPGVVTFNTAISACGGPGSETCRVEALNTVNTLPIL